MSKCAAHENSVEDKPFYCMSKCAAFHPELLLQWRYYYKKHQFTSKRSDITETVYPVTLAAT